MSGRGGRGGKGDKSGRGGRGRGRGRGGSGGAAPPPDLSPKIDAADKQVKKLRKTLDSIKALQKKAAAGETLEGNQREKLKTSKKVAEDLAACLVDRQALLIAADAGTRAKFGACTNCGREGHTDSNCPRPKSKQSTPIQQQNRKGRAVSAPHARTRPAPSSSPTPTSSTSASTSTTNTKQSVGVPNTARSSGLTATSRNHAVKAARPMRDRERGQFLDSGGGGGGGGTGSAAVTTAATKTASSQPSSRQVTCPACTFLNDSRLSACEMCGTILPNRHQQHHERSSSRDGSVSADASNVGDGGSNYNHERPGSRGGGGGGSGGGGGGERSGGRGSASGGGSRGRGGSKKKVPIFLQGKGKKRRDASPPPPTTGLTEVEASEKLADIERTRKKLMKSVEQVALLRKRYHDGEVLEENQLAKVNRYNAMIAELGELDAKAMSILQQALPAAREALGACGRCGSKGHSTSNCPRSQRVVRAVEYDPKAEAAAAAKEAAILAAREKASTAAASMDMFLPRGGTVEGHGFGDTTTGVASGMSASALASASASASSASASTTTIHAPSVAKVLCIAEKPSVAKAIAAALSGGKMRSRMCGGKGKLRVHEFFQYFPPAKGKCSIAVSSVVGHVFGLDFDEMTGSDPINLFGAHTRKHVAENATSFGVLEALLELAEGVDYLYLWLDCDREGENICFEVITVLRSAGYFDDNGSIFRAEFSALTAVDIKRAFHHPGKPDAAKANAVDARQEMDLKIGCSFTRFLTRQVLVGARATFNDKELTVVSYGPCQTPALRFCVVRQREIAAFIPRKYWELSAQVSVAGSDLIATWEKTKTFSESEAKRVHSRVLGGCGKPGKVTSYTDRLQSVPPPVGMNTVALLKLAANSLGLSPHKAMEVAERLYIAGYISYPRTESTAFSPHFDVHAICVEHQGHPDWGLHATNLIARAGAGGAGAGGVGLGLGAGAGAGGGRGAGKVSVPRTRGGVDAGDHPPITPTQCCTRSKIKNSDEYRLYDIIARTFFATLSPAFTYREWKCAIELGGNERFQYSHFVVEKQGWTELLPWRVSGVTRGLPEAPKLRAKKNDPVTCHGCDKIEKITVPPPFLRESDLVDLMDKHGIGTDASISQHIQTICERKYVVVCDENGVKLPDESHGPNGSNSGGGGRGGGGRSRGGGRGRGGGGGGGGGGRDHGGDTTGNTGSKGVVLRHMVPTPLGAALISCFDEVCPRLAQPSLRASMERQLTLIATGAADKNTVLDENLASFLREYSLFASEIARVRPHFVSDGAIDGIIEATRAAAADQHLNKLSDSAIRRQDEEASVVSDVIADAERRRRLADREAASQASRASGMSEEDQIKSLFSYGAPTSDRAVAGYTETSGQQRFYGGSGGVAHYTAELQRLRELPVSNVEHAAAAALPLQNHRRNKGGGGRGGGRGGVGGGRGRKGGGGAGHVRASNTASTTTSAAATAAASAPRKQGESRERRKGVFLGTGGSSAGADGSVGSVVVAGRGRGSKGAREGGNHRGRNRGRGSGAT